MRNPLTKFFKQYLSSSKSDRNATVIIIIILLLGIVANEIVKRFPAKSNYDYFKFAKEMEEWENSQLPKNELEKSLFKFNPNTISKKEIDSLLLPDFVIRNLLSYRYSGGVFYEPSDLKKLYGMNDSIFEEIESFIIIPKEKKVYVEKPKTSIEAEIKGTFNPNSAGLDTLSYFGLNNFQAENLISYRSNGGRFRNPEDLLKIYGIDSLFYAKIKDHIFIEDSELANPENASIDLVVELNSADSAQLVKITGIGSVFASRIVKYRDLLGGFYKSTQLLEVYNFPEETYAEVQKNVKVDSTLVKKIRINFAQYEELIRHPYFNNSTVNAILQYREKNGAFSAENEIKNINDLDSITINKIMPYISCR